MFFQEKSRKGSSNVYKSPHIPTLSLQNIKNLSPEDHMKNKSAVLEVIDDEEESELKMT